MPYGVLGPTQRHTLHMSYPLLDSLLQNEFLWLGFVISAFNNQCNVSERMLLFRLLLSAQDSTKVNICI